MSALAPTRASLRVPTELALVAVNVAALVGFRRLFVGWGFLTEPLVLLLLSHLVAIALRARRVPVPLAALGSAAVGVVATSLLLYQGTTRYWLPNLSTLDAVGDDLQLALELFRDVKAPAEVLPGFIVATAMTFWVVGFLADWAAFRLDAAVEATIPAGGLFIFGALFGADILRLELTVIFALACLVFVLLHRSARQEVGMPWVRGDARRGSRAFVRAGATLTALGVLLGLAAAPLLPGSGSAPLLDWKDLGGRQGTRITVSPLVDIRQRLVDQEATVAFEVVSPVRSYWRLTALDSFDGQLWRSDQRFTRVEDDLDGATDAPLAQIEPVAQQFTIEKLSQIWLPAAYLPTDIDTPDGVEVRWEDSTSTLIVDDATSDGMVYNVTSAVPSFDEAALAAAPVDVPDDIREQYLGLPQDFSPDVRALAQAVTAQASGPYGQAMALQAFFRDGERFRYSTEVPAGHGEDYLARFVLQDRVGYCEQFAGSFAAMARSIGLPARVAVGFTPGDPDPTRPGTWIVRGEHAHAWPEVYISGFGWVLFEPTPGRGAPGAGYTGVEEDQEGGAAEPTSTEGSITTTTVASSPTPSPDGGVLIDEFGNGAVSGTSTTAPPPATGGGVFGQARWVLPGLLALGLLYVLVLLTAKPVRRVLRRRRARTERQQVDLAWREALESLAVLGIEAEPSETPTEFAGRVRRRSRVDAGGLGELAELATEARYAAGHDMPGAGEQARGTATAVLEAVKDQTTVGQRLSYDLSPRSLWRRARRRT